MKFLLSLLLFLTTTFAWSQLEVQVGSTYNSLPGWQVAFENGLTGKHSPFMRFGTSIMFRYRQPVTRKFYFAPAFAIDRNTQDFNYHHFELVGFGLNGIAGYRFLTITKEEKSADPLFSLSTELVFGMSYSSMRYNRPVFSDGEYTGEHEDFEDHMLTSHLGANLTSNILVSEKFGFGPMAGLRYVPTLEWNDLPVLVDPSLPGNLGKTYLIQWTVGIKLYWRFAKRSS